MAIARPGRTLALLALAVALAAFVAVPVTSSLQPFSSEDPGSQSVAARDAIERATGVDPYFNLIALVPTPAGVDSAAARTLVAKVQAALAGDPVVGAVHSYDAERQPGLLALDGRSTLVVGELRALAIASQLDGARRIERRLAGLPSVKLGGLAAFYAQGNQTARSDLIRSELFAFPLLLLISLWVYRGLVAALLPLLIGAVTVIGTLAVLRIASELTDVSIYALNITTALGLGLSVDYSLLILSRYREEMARTGPTRAALTRTLQSAGRTVLISSLTVAGVLSCLLAFPQPFLRSIGLGGMLVAGIAGASSLVILPAVLSLLRWRVNSLSPARWRRAAHERARALSTGGWGRLARLVVDHPVSFVLASAVLLLALSKPVLDLRVTQVDASVVPEGSGARIVHDSIAAHYPRSDNAPLLLAIRARDTVGARTELARYTAQLRGLRAVAAVQGPRYLGRQLWQINIAPYASPLSAASQTLVREVRRLPTVLPVLVGGETASLVDLKRSLSRHIPLALAILVLVTAGSVLVVTGSLVLPLLAMLVGALTMMAAFGVLVLVFQDGALEGLFDYSSSHALEASTLVLIFAMSFGLATDYGIFLFSRIMEMRRRGHDYADAVRRGLERTGRVVSAAALLLCVALGSLMTARHALVKEVGFGAAIAVAIDATIVRAMLLPSAIRLLRGLAWRSPGARAERARPERASATTPVRVSPGEQAPARIAQALEPTRYCDHDAPAIRRALAALGADVNGADDRALAVAAFHFVRDEVPYTLGPWGVSASSTLAQRTGMCTNKANLLVGLLRAAGIPAAYGVLRVNAREYFGVVGAPFLTRHISAESTHVYAAAFLGGRWVKCDPSTDRLLASRTSHFCRQTQLIEWDGSHDSLDFLDPRHIYADLGLYASIDELLAKPSRGATPERFALWNDYLSFIRRQPPYPSSEALIAAYRSQASTQRLLTLARGRSHRRARKNGS